MVSLTSKIRSIFKSSAYKNFNLTYVDEDGDMIYLVDDDDLHDAMRQPLKFLIIDVHENGLFPFQSSQCFPGLVCSVIFFLFIKAIKVLQNWSAWKWIISNLILSMDTIHKSHAKIQWNEDMSCISAFVDMVIFFLYIMPILFWGRGRHGSFEFVSSLVWIIFTRFLVWIFNGVMLWFVKTTYFFFWIITMHCQCGSIRHFYLI